MKEIANNEFIHMKMVRGREANIEGLVVDRKVDIFLKLLINIKDMIN